jgi:hypothetical protein
MPLTRPTVENINTTITELTDPVSVLNKGGVSARQDVGFVINRDGGGTANVAIYWDETNDRFNLVNTTSSGATNSNVAISSYANLNIHTLDALGSVATAKVNITNTSLDDSILITTTEASSTAGPVVSLKRNSASPADGDYLGQIKFKGENDADEEIVYSKITGKVLDASDGTEDGILEFAFMKAGSQNISARFRSDSLQLINGTTLTVNGLISTDSTITAGGLINTAGNVSAAVVNAGTLTTTGNITAGNLNTTGTVTLDRLSLSSSQTTVSPLHLTASNLNDGVGALRIDGAQADIFLNPSTATHTTVTFAVNNDQRLAFGMDNSSDFYITRRTGGTWYDDTLVIDRDSGQVSLGYDLTVSGNVSSGNILASGNVTAPYYFGNGSQLSGIITSVTEVSSGTSSVEAFESSNIAVSVTGSANTVVFAKTETVVFGNVRPSANITYDLGTNNRRWKDLYLSGGTINLGPVTISASDNHNVVVSGNAAMIMPVGVTGQRNNQQGALRYSTTLGKFEGYDGASWNSFSYAASDFPTGDYGDVTTTTSDAFGVLLATTFDCNDPGALATEDFGAFE